jgi:hypothetical protein
MRRPRHHESFDPVIISREISREMSRDAAREVSHEVERDDFDGPETLPDPEPVFVPEPAFDSNPAPVASQESALAYAPHTAEVISLDAMRLSAPNYEVEDLDVPAFLRKRSEVM